MSASLLEQSGSSPPFHGRHSSSTMPQSATLSPPALQLLMRQVVDELRSSGFVTHDEMGAHVSFRADTNVTDQLSGLRKRVGAVERKFTDPDGTMARSSQESAFWRTGVPGTPPSVVARRSAMLAPSRPGSRPLRIRTYSVIALT